MNTIQHMPEFDLAEMLKTEQDIATYLTLVIEEGDVSELSHAQGIAARARGMPGVPGAGRAAGGAGGLTLP